MILVSGYSGIGKTAIVNEVQKPIVRQRGYFISGKFDQFKRNIPYASLIQAFQSLIQQLLTESDASIQTWKQKLLTALGSNGQVVADVIPEVELIIEKQPEVPQLGPTESQNRFNRVFKQFISVFAAQSHPLVVFLDDLQWADSASLKLIELLVTDSDSKYLLIIGAYRDNEVSPTHPLIQTIEKIALLAELFFNKTQGNPFFLTQLLRAIYQENLLVYDFQSGAWQWDLEHIQAVGITDCNVVELVARNIKKLPDVAQSALKLAACIGNQFNLEVLAIVSEKSQKETALNLWDALQAGLVLPLSNDYKIPLVFEGAETGLAGLQDVKVDYKFLHDRVQQAAYSLIPEEQKQETHLKIGQLLLQSEYITSNFSIWRQMNLNLRGLSADKYRLVGASFDEEMMLPQWLVVKNGWLVFNVYLAKSMILYLFKDFKSAVDSAALAAKYLQGVGGWIAISAHNFYYSLALLAVYPTADTQAEYLQEVEANQEKMEHWAVHAPMNFLHKYELVEAEKARVLGEKEKAMDYYDRAIQNAATQGYIQEEALANELAAEFYLSLGREKVAKTYMTDAYYGYIRWGANAKVADLEERYPQLIVRVPQINTSFSTNHHTLTIASLTTTATQKALDFTTVIKASLAIYGEIILDSLLKKLMGILLENAGAQTGCLIASKSGEFVVEAAGEVDGDMRVLSGAGLDYAYPRSLINFVDKHGGMLRCTSIPGKGTEFAIELPIQQQVRDMTASGSQPAGC